MRVLLWICVVILGVISLPIFGVFIALFWPSILAMRIIKDNDNSFTLAMSGQLVWLVVIILLWIGAL